MAKTFEVIHAATAFWEHHDDDPDAGAATPAAFFELATEVLVPGAHPTPPILAVLVMFSASEFKRSFRLRKYHAMIENTAVFNWIKDQELKPVAHALLRGDLPTAKQAWSPLPSTIIYTEKQQGIRLLHLAALGGNSLCIMWAASVTTCSFTTPSTATGWVPLLYAIESGDVNAIAACGSVVLCAELHESEMKRSKSEGAEDNEDDEENSSVRHDTTGMTKEEVLNRIFLDRVEEATRQIARQHLQQESSLNMFPANPKKRATSDSGVNWIHQLLSYVEVPSSLQENAMRAAARSGNYRLLHWAVSNRFPVPKNLALDAARSGDVEVLRRVVLGLGCDFDITEERFGNNVMQELASVASISGLCFCFEELPDPEDRMGPQKNGKTIAFSSLESGNIGVLAFCLDCGAGSISEKGLLQFVVQLGNKKLLRWCTNRLAAEQRASVNLQKEKKERLKNPKYNRWWP